MCVCVCVVKVRIYKKLKAKRFSFFICVCKQVCTLSRRNEVRGNKHEAQQYASFTVYTPYKVRYCHSCDSVGCRLYEGFLLCIFFWLTIRKLKKNKLCKNVIIKGLLLLIL